MLSFAKDCLSKDLTYAFRQMANKITSIMNPAESAILRNITENFNDLATGLTKLFVSSRLTTRFAVVTTE
jgi:hypothetical protein